MDFLLELLRRFQGAAWSANDWPPSEVREAWETVEYYRARFRNDPGLLLPYAPAFSAGSYERQSQFTPVPLAREIARYSAALLFSSPADITLESNQDSLDELMHANGAEAFWQEAAETVAVEGRGALRVIVDEETSDEPLITYVNEDQILWDVRHGRFVRGGIVVIEAESENRLDTYRMLEGHQPGLITRAVYRGKGHYLGQKVPVDADYLPIELQGFEEKEETGLDVPTLIRWENVPGGRSDLFAIEVLLDRLDEGESLLLEKARKSRPWIFANRSLADESGNVDISNLLFLKQSEASEYLDEKQTGAPVVAVQPEMQTSEHVAWLSHMREMALTLAGYSLASWGLEDGGTAESGTALRLRQSRTLITRSAKERMAREAMTTAIAVAMARKQGASDIEPFKPEIAFGDGMPRDEEGISRVIQALTVSEAISSEQKIRTLHPEWDDERVQTEIAAIQGALQAAAPSPLDAVLARRAASVEGNGSGALPNREER